ECLIHPSQSFLATFPADSPIRSVRRSSAVNGVLLTPAFIFDQNSSIGFKKEE
ncbi:hypothetical protein BDF14DRAFT_1727516, partial [Spinellus fusiger]